MSEVGEEAKEELHRYRALLPLAPFRLRRVVEGDHVLIVVSGVQRLVEAGGVREFTSLG